MNPSLLLYFNYRQLSLSPEQFYKTTDQYIQSYIKDGKKINPDFELLNELYIVTVGDSFT